MSAWTWMAGNLFYFKLIYWCQYTRVLDLHPLLKSLLRALSIMAPKPVEKYSQYTEVMIVKIKTNESISIVIISLHIRSMWETTVMHKQVSGWRVNFGPNSPVYPFLELKTRIPPPPFRKTSDLGWPKFTLEYPPISENFRFGMTKVYSGIPPHFRKLQIWDDRNTPPPNFGKLQIWDDQSLLRNTPPNGNCQRVQVRDFQNTESYYMWRLYPTRITTRCIIPTTVQNSTHIVSFRIRKGTVQRRLLPPANDIWGR